MNEVAQQTRNFGSTLGRFLVARLGTGNNSGVTAESGKQHETK